jgi:hypothetical protein
MVEINNTNHFAPQASIKNVDIKLSMTFLKYETDTYIIYMTVLKIKKSNARPCKKSKTVLLCPMYLILLKYYINEYITSLYVVLMFDISKLKKDSTSE